MSWKERAIPASNQASAPQGSWKDRAMPSQGTTPTSDDNYWGDTGASAKREISEIPSMFKSNIEPTKKIARGMLGGWPESMGQMATGTPFKQTPVGEAYGAGTQMAKGVGATAWQGVKATGSLMKAPFEDAPMRNTEIGQKFRQAPIATTLGIAGTVLPIRGMARGARSAFAGAEPNFLERIGARGTNNALQIQPDTTEGMTPRGGNAGKVGTNLGLELHDEGLSGLTPTEAYDPIQSKMETYGQDVKNRVADIKAQNRRFGEWPEIENPLKRESNPILKPLIDEANKLEGSYDTADKFSASHHRGVYNELADAAEQHGGYTTLDDIREQMQKIGGKLGQANPLDPRFPVLRTIYGKLAKIQDDMVTDVADSSGRPELRQGLKDANAKYSRMARIKPDVFHAAGKEGVGRQTALGGEVKKSMFKAAQPAISKFAIKAGRGLRGVSELADTVTGAPVKAAKSLFNKGKEIAGDQRGSIFPKANLPPGMKPSEMFTPAEQKFGVSHANEQQYLANNDFQGALRSKWGMAANSGGNFTPEEVSVPTKTLTESRAREFLKKAKGDKAKARKMASEEGWSF